MLASGLIFIAALQLEWIKRKSAEKFNEEKKKQTKQQRKSVQVPKRNHIEQYFLNLD